MKVYTKTGDTGTTSLLEGLVPKDHIRIESYGTVDELNSYIGLFATKRWIHTKTRWQKYKIAYLPLAILATPQEKEVKKRRTSLENLGILETDIELLENEIDSMENELPEMTHFVLPGGHTVSHCHIARCVCRRAERLLYI
jgi:cob(I)alamin adenosyltransferase